MSVNLERDSFSLRVGDGERLPKIFVFCNSSSPGWVSMSALTEDGEFIAGHACSELGWGPHDMGMVGDWKHEHYRERYPDGFELVWVPKPKESAELMAAHAKHVAAGEEGTPWQRERKAAP